MEIDRRFMHKIMNNCKQYTEGMTKLYTNIIHKYKYMLMIYIHHMNNT